MKGFAIVFLISVLILIPGCLGTQREVVNVYVCADGSLASNADDCEISKEECPEAEIVEITNYVCSNSEIVDDVDECVIASTSLPETSSTTVQETTTLEELDTTIAEGTTSTVETTTTSSTTTLTGDDSCAELGCPPGTGFVGSVNSEKYHYCDCRYVGSIKPENIICFADEDEAQDQDYVPCGTCKPPT